MLARAHRIAPSNSAPDVCCGLARHRTAAGSQLMTPTSSSPTGSEASHGSHSSHSSHSSERDGVDLRLVWPQWQGAGSSSVRALASEFPFDGARRGYAVGTAGL